MVSGENPQHPSAERLAAARDTVQREIQQYRIQYGEQEWRIYYYNNFHFNLPRTDFPGGGFYRNLYVQLESMNRPFSEVWGPSERVHYSDHKAAQTAGQFYGSIDRAIEEEGLNVDEITRLSQVADEASGTDTYYDRIAGLFDYAQPAFIRLRAEGYNLHDLTA